MAAIAALAISGGIAAYSAYQSSEASKDAARMQSDAANRAAGLQDSQYQLARNDLSQYRNLGWDAANQLRNMQLENTQQPWTGTLNLPTYDYGAFVAPTIDEARNDPGYRLMQEEDQRAIQQSAAARGTLLGGNTLQALQGRSQALADQQYGSVFGRALSGYQSNAQNAWNAYQSRYNAAAGEYDAARTTFYENQDRPWQRALTLANLGYGAASAGAGIGQGYAANMGNLYLQQGNALAAGRIGSSNAWNQGMYNASNDALAAYWLYSQRRPTTTTAPPANGYDG